MRAAVAVQLPPMVIHRSFRLKMFHSMVTLILRVLYERLAVPFSLRISLRSHRHP